MSNIEIRCPDCGSDKVTIDEGHFTEDYLIGGVPVNTWISTTNYCDNKGCYFEWSEFDEGSAEFPNAIPADYQEG